MNFMQGLAPSGAEFAVVDLFAGPGGLAEGFSSLTFKGVRPFSVVLSIEKDPAAHATLLLRNFLRRFNQGFPREYYEFLNGRISEPDWRLLYPEQWSVAECETLNLELGNRHSADEINDRIDAIRRKFGQRTILIGGPPCQAYSLVGRARNQGIKGYDAGRDHRHFLYREYIRILKRLRPAAFVMENVRGLLSSTVRGENVFRRVLRDLQTPEIAGGKYRLAAVMGRSDAEALLKADDFLVRTEEFGLPQARHRVILAGILDEGEWKQAPEPRLRRRPMVRATVRDVIGGIPRLRSCLSESDGDAEWVDVVSAAMKGMVHLSSVIPDEHGVAFRKRARECLRLISELRGRSLKTSGGRVAISRNCPPALRDWLIDPLLEILPNHTTRSHMAQDLSRYLYAALFAEVAGRSPKASEFPASLAPRHRNWRTGKFSDRFRVQVWDQPGTTVTSHISKDGHYYIHPDPLQCRSLTVREAARLQTFPDNYLFKGTRTQQYIQVGNAVPPLMAKYIAEALLASLLQVGQSRSRAGSGSVPGKRVAIMVC